MTPTDTSFDLGSLAFEAEDFEYYHYDAKSESTVTCISIEKANAILRAKLEKAPEVRNYQDGDYDWVSWTESDNLLQHKNSYPPPASARLVLIKEIK